MTRMLIQTCAALLLALTFAFPALAQDQSAPGGAVGAEELQKLVDTLESDSDRQHMVQQLKALIAAQRQVQKEVDDSLLGRVTERLEAIGDDAMDAVAALQDAPKLMAWAGQQVSDPAMRGRWADTAWRLGALLAACVLADVLLAWLLRRAERVTVPQETDPSMLVRLPLGLARALIRTVPVMAAAAIAYGLLTLLDLRGNVRVAGIMVVSAYASVRLLMVLARLLAAPRTPNLRLLPVDDETAEYLVIWSRRLIGMGVFGGLAIEAARLLGLPRGAATVSFKTLGLAMATMLVIFILQNRQTVARALRGGEGEGRFHLVRARLSEIWHILAVLYVAAGYVVWALKVKGGFEFMLRASVLSVVILLAAAMLSRALGRLIERGFAIGQDARSAFPLLEARANRYLPVLHVVLRGAVAVITALALAQAWGLDTLALLSSSGGRQVVSSLISIGAVLLGALVVWELVSGAIERYLAATDDDGKALERSARIRTLLPLIRNALFVVLVVMVSLIVLSELGVNIAPLLAGAGVVGVAIGFGSQTLVKDVITGAFMLFEDTMAVGDTVKINGVQGTVEAMSIRTIRLRDTAGAVHTIPFSSVSSVVNLSRDHALASFEVGVGYGEDPDQVMLVIGEVGEELRRDAAFGPLIVAPVEVFGLDRFDASAIVFTGRFKTMPMKGRAVVREFNRRLKKRFDELGIEMPFPQTTVWFGEDKAGKAPPARVALQEEVTALPKVAN